MNSEFENLLSRQNFRPLPAEWRSEILRARNAEPSPWWQDWLWPSPRAWMGVAAAWCLILLLHFMTPSDASGAGRVAVPLQTFAHLQHEIDKLAQAPDAPPPETVPPPRPRTSRELNVGMG